MVAGLGLQMGETRARTGNEKRPLTPGDAAALTVLTGATEGLLLLLPGWCLRDLLVLLLPLVAWCQRATTRRKHACGTTYWEAAMRFAISEYLHSLPLLTQARQAGRERSHCSG